MQFKRGRFAVLFFSLVFSGSACGQQGKSFRYLFEGHDGTRFSVDANHNVTIYYSVPEVIFSGVTNPTGDFYRISIPGHIRTSEPGKPELPVFTKLIMVPENSRAVVSVSDVKYTKVKPSGFRQKGLLYPKQEDAVKDAPQKRDFIIDRTIYSRKGLLLSDTVRIEYIGRLRNNNLAAVQISPVRYNPYRNELEIITSMKISISFQGQVSKGSTSPTPVSPVLGQSLAKGIINYYPDGFIPGYSTRPVGMVILTDSSFKKLLKPFINWKTEQGFRITPLYRGTWTGSNTFTTIKDTLTKIYNAGTEENPAPEYLLIVGDVNKIPLSDGTSQVSDMYYGEFDGNGDYIPDMFIGRLPVADTTELKNVMTKLLQYEKFEFADSNKFYSRALVSAGDDGGYDVYMNGQVNYASTYYLNPSNQIEGHIFNYPESVTSADSIKLLINNGLAFMNYTGHGDISGWISPALRVADVANFQNRNMYPFIITNACQTAHFNYAASLGNRMIVSAEKGAIGYIGCSNDSYWDEDYYWSVGVGSPVVNPIYNETALGAYDRLFHKNGEKPSDWYITMGQVNYAGNLSVSSSTSPRKKYYWETYTLLGDPSLIPFIGKPDSVNIQVPAVLPRGITSFSLITNPFAYVAVSRHDTLFDASYASPDGSVTLNIPGTTGDSCLFVATGQNRIPYIKKVSFGNIADEFINLTSTAVNDSSGNNNGKADFNESVWLSLVIDNLGNLGADSISARLTTNSNLIKILSDSVYIGTLNGKSKIILPRAMSIKVADSVPDKAFIPLDLVVKDKKTQKRYRIDLMVHAPDLRILSCYIDDTGVGNGNFIPEPGETVNLIFKVSNSGSSSAAGTFSINCTQTGITIVPPRTKLGIIDGGETVTYTMPLTLSESVSLGSYFTINSALTCLPYNQTGSFCFRIGKARENFEVNSFNIFPWINVSPKPWTITSTDAYDGIYSARSGSITHNESTSLIIKISLDMPDSVRFYCKVSSEEYYDFLTCKLNGNVAFRMSGESGWQRKALYLPQGLNRIEWIYSKDEAVSAGLDCAFLDLIDFPDPSEVVYIQKDLSVDRIISPLQSGNFVKDSVSVRVSNQGKDPFNGFDLAYSINGELAGYQHFENILSNYLDSATVWFRQKPDLSKYDIYNIKVFSFNSHDDYALNDTVSTTIENIRIVEPFKAYPNPFNDKFRIIINAGASDDITIKLINSVGVTVKILTSSIIKGENDIDIDTSTIPSGFYYLYVKGRTMTRTSSMIKLK